MKKNKIKLKDKDNSKPICVIRKIEDYYLVGLEIEGRPVSEYSFKFSEFEKAIEGLGKITQIPNPR